MSSDDSEANILMIFFSFEILFGGGQFFLFNLVEVFGIWFEEY